MLRMSLLYRSASVSIRVQTILPSKRESDLEIIFAQSLLKGEKMDYLIQKATELGVKRIVPFISSRSIPSLEKTKRIERHRRWEKIAIVHDFGIWKLTSVAP